MIINAKDLVLGRFATVAAKRALLGEKVIIVNCDSAVISGDKYKLYKDYSRRKNMGTFKGPFMPKMPDRFVKRAIRGMLPYKLEKGRKAFDSIKCFVGVPSEYKDKEFEKIENAEIKNLHTVKFVYVKDICKNLGANI